MKADLVGREEWARPFAAGPVGTLGEEHRTRSREALTLSAPAGDLAQRRKVWEPSPRRCVATER